MFQPKVCVLFGPFFIFCKTMALLIRTTYFHKSITADMYITI